MNTQDIWELYSDELRKFILSKTRDTNLTEDVLQETFVKVHTKKESLQNKSSLKSWLFSVAYHTLLDEFRKQNKEIPNLIKETTTNTLESPNHDPKDCLLPLIQNLPKKYKDVLFLSTLKGLKQHEIAEKLNLSLSATKSRTLRGRELLKQSYMDCCDYTLDENGHLKGEHKNIEDCKVCRPQLD